MSKAMIKDIPEEDRTLTLLRAAYQLLQKQEDSVYVLNMLEQITIWDNAECDGYCLKDEILMELEEANVDPDYIEAVL